MPGGKSRRKSARNWSRRDIVGLPLFSSFSASKPDPSLLFAVAFAWVAMLQNVGFGLGGDWFGVRRRDRISYAGLGAGALGKTPCCAASPLAPGRARPPGAGDRSRPGTGRRDPRNQPRLAPLASGYSHRNSPSFNWSSKPTPFVATPCAISPPGAATWRCANSRTC